MKRRDQFFLFVPICILVLMAVSVGLFLFQFRSFERSHLEDAKGNLAHLTSIVVALLKDDLASHKVERISENISVFYGQPFRITVIDPQGRVVADSDADVAQMVNHADRPEVLATELSPSDFELRHSSTMDAVLLYYALRLEDGWIVRTSLPVSSILNDLTRLWWVCATAILLGVGLAGTLFLYLFLRVRPQFTALQGSAVAIAHGDLQAPIHVPKSGVLRELTEAVASMSHQLRARIHELDRERSELRRLERFRTDFVANVSHEIKTPLTAILSTVETLTELPLDEAGQEKCLAILKRQARRLNDLVQDILSLAAIERRQGTDELTPLSLDGLVRDAIALCQDEADRTDVALNLLPLPAVTVKGDARLLEQAIVNLVTNAIRHSGTRLIEVNLTLNADKASLTVRDEGCGIEEKHLPRLFERFYRVHKGRSRENGGTGLGLAIVKHIAILHHGTVHVTSTPGTGTTFTLTLPTAHNI